MSSTVVIPIKPRYAEIASRELNNWIDCAKAQYMARLRERLGHDPQTEIDIRNYDRMLTQFAQEAESRVSMFFESMEAKGVDFSAIAKHR